MNGTRLSAVSGEEVIGYIETEMKPALEALGFHCRVLRQPKWRGPFLVGERIEAEGLPTVLGYGHGDVIRGLDAGWRPGPRKRPSRRCLR